jgi:hypothetical protein
VFLYSYAEAAGGTWIIGVILGGMAAMTASVHHWLSPPLYSSSMAVIYDIIAFV